MFYKPISHNFNIPFVGAWLNTEPYFSFVGAITIEWSTNSTNNDCLNTSSNVLLVNSINIVSLAIFFYNFVVILFNAISNKKK